MAQFKESKNPFIINSLLDIDFYKFTMGYFIFKYFPMIPVCFGFTCRTKGIVLPDTVSEADLRRELEHVRELRFQPDELEYLRQQGLGDEEYLRFLGKLQLPLYELEYVKGRIHLTFPSAWKKCTYWETLSLSIINELHYRALMAQKSPEDREAVYDLGEHRLAEKIGVLLQNPRITFSEFGTRRRFSRDWQEHVVAVLKDSLDPSQFIGTSNIYLAKKYGLLPIGTNAHELPMVCAGIMGDDDEGLRDSQAEIRRLWFELYGPKRAINLPDTFGSEFVFQTMTRQEAHDWIGFRHDSGDPPPFGERVIRFYKDHGADPRRKVIVFSDGLDIGVILSLDEQFYGRMQITYGWGTDLTNDLGFQTLSLVTKAVRANGRSLVKLSDTRGKFTGEQTEVERYVRIFGYDQVFDKELVS